ncbi:hypothetical protein [Bacteroides heparinolyticus]|uniref:hypothetical protein n=1 Tax=Prevotella heparinolytica TaxID=28113 RepID=UPI0035A1442C
MITISFSRESVCMGDDVGSGEYKIALQDSATLGELLNVILCGDCGNDWPIPHTVPASNWVIRSNIGELAKILSNSNGDYHITDYCCDEHTPLKQLGIKWTFGSRD